MNKFKEQTGSVLATGIVLLSGCGKEEEVNNIITNNITIEDVLSSQDSDLNQSLSALNYSDDLSDYSDARTKKSISSCSRALSNLGKKLLESSVCTLLDIDVENVVDFQVSPTVHRVERYQSGDLKLPHQAVDIILFNVRL